MITDGFTESKHRPWPAGAQFVTLHHHPKWLDLLHRRQDGALIYLSTKPYGITQ